VFGIVERWGRPGEYAVVPRPRLPSDWAVAWQSRVVLFLGDPGADTHWWAGAAGPSP